MSLGQDGCSHIRVTSEANEVNICLDKPHDISVCLGCETRNGRDVA